MIDHHQLEVDGVIVHHFPSDEPLTSVCLIFAVGGRDETMPTVGSLHALEHLAMSEVRRTPLDINGSVDAMTTQFTAYGRSVLAGPWLARLCHALTNPPTDRLDREAAVLIAEGEGSGFGADPLDLVRFGNRDLAMGAAPHPSPRSLNRVLLRDDAHRWFSRSNAVLVIDGPLPELRLPLPDSGPLKRHRPSPRSFARPEVVLADAGCVAVSLVLPPPDPAGLDALTCRLLENRISEVVRHDGGLAYHVEGQARPTIDRRTLVTLLAEPGPGQEIAASAAFLGAVQSLLRGGPTDEELGQARGQVEAAGEGRQSEISRHVEDSLSTLISGSPHPVTEPALIRGVTRDQIRHYHAGLADDVLFLLPEDAAELAEQRGLPARPIEPLHPALPAGGVVYRPSRLARMTSREARSVQLVVTDDALWLQILEEIFCVRWRDAAALMQDDENTIVVLYGLDGTAIAIDPRLTDSDQAVTEIRRRVADDLVYVHEGALPPDERPTDPA